MSQTYKIKSLLSSIKYTQQLAKCYKIDGLSPFYYKNISQSYDIKKYESDIEKIRLFMIDPFVVHNINQSKQKSK